jgi:hypothetical protein
MIEPSSRKKIPRILSDEVDRHPVTTGQHHSCDGLRIADEIINSPVYLISAAERKVQWMDLWTAC